MKKVKKENINFSEDYKEEMLEFKIISKHEVEIRQEFAATFYNVVAFTKKFPEITAAILNAVTIEDPKWKISCPFPGECRHFPCRTLRCDCTALSNGDPITAY